MDDASSILLERGRRELSAWTATTRRRNGHVQLRRPAPVHAERLSGSCRSAATDGGSTDGFGATLPRQLGSATPSLALQSGRPFTVAIHPDIDNSNTGRASLGFGVNDRPNVVGNPSVAIPGLSAGSTRRRSPCRPSARSATSAATRSTAPGFKNLNLAFARKRRDSSAARFQLRLEIFNLFNCDQLRSA